MRPLLTSLAAGCAGALLLACAGPLRGGAPGPAAAAAAAVPSVEQRNREATALAERGDYPAAIALWRTLAAGVRAPEDAYLLRNLGYAQYLHKDYGEALVTLGQACLLDPLNARGWRQLGAAFERQGEAGRAQLMYRQAAALEQHDLRADMAVAPSAAPALAQAAQAPVAAASDWPGAVVLDASSGVVELPAMESGDAAAASAVLLEITNGNGIRGMAAAAARRIGNDSVRVVRLSNEKGFRVRETRLEYERSHRAQAERLAGTLGASALVEVESCRAADMRLVLGRDQVAAAGDPVRTRRASPRPRAG
ncbi:MAG: LytR C-terminal domain-containing protein [Telluria sp.]